MNLNTKDANFEKLVTFCYTLPIPLDFHTIRRLRSIISSLETKIKSLNSKKEGNLKIKNSIIKKINYWETILNQGVESIELNELNCRLLIESICYNIDCINLIVTNIHKRYTPEEIAEIIDNVLPDAGVFYYLEEIDGENIKPVDYPVMQLIQFTKNYAFSLLYIPLQNVPDDFKQGYLILEKLLIDRNIYSDIFKVYNDSISNNLSYVKYSPCYIYINSTESKKIASVLKALYLFIDSLGFEIIFEFHPIISSWIQRIILRAKNWLTSEDFQLRLRKIEHGIEIKNIELVQAEINKYHAEALSAVLNSISDIPEISILSGSLLIVKAPNEKNITVIYSRILNTEELFFLKDNTYLLDNPCEIKKALNDFNK